ncbi:hypothetical protein B0T26DRAFT_680724 [Lasiosphaeria miniovina]|uniref:Uncharacterized protein n=1 Tax=Lasiosphaeria miniovina TaxID=1954250 RepID=A0AA39ZSW8_9PEZI|nr:uncharacterized protein B0T26DRAFT_680724 [Lasiosphaeria miniovina]KAK0702953.1 hypothetical protein B0T26DRAFT_680724 [Lasiosphaeria miniovina]
MTANKLNDPRIGEDVLCYGGLSRRHLYDQNLRHFLWDQVLLQTELPEPSYLDWISGTYTTTVPVLRNEPESQYFSNREILIPVTLRLDFSADTEQMVRWTIDARPSKMKYPSKERLLNLAYPGLHTGCSKVKDLGSFDSICEVTWETPMFSPYIRIETANRSGQREAVQPVVMEC